MAQSINLEPQTLDLTLYAGDGVIFRLVVTDNDNQPVPLTGTIDAQIRLTRTTADPPAAEFAVDLTDADTGIVLLSLTGEQTHTLASSKKFSGVWDLQWTPVGAEPRSLVQGKVECVLDVTH